MREQFTHFTTTTATTLAENLDSANERALDAVVDANRRLVEFAVTTADRVADQFSFELPFADRLPTLPTAAERGERYLDFVERAVAVNREFNEKIIAMLKSDTVTVETLVAKITKAADEMTTQATSQAADVAAAVKTTATTTAKSARTTAQKVSRTAPARKVAAAKTTTAKAASTAKKSAAKRPAAKKSTAKKSTAKATTATAPTGE